MRFLIAILLLCSLYLLNSCNSAKRNQNIYPDCSSTDIAKIDTCLLGLTLRQAIEKLKLDTSEFSTIQEPIAVLRGISYTPDSLSTVELYVERTPIKSEIDSIRQNGGERISARYFYRFIMEKPIQTVIWTKDQGLHEKVLSKTP